MKFNPLLTKEFRTRLRSWRAPVLITSYLAIIGLLGWAFYDLQVYQAMQISPNVGMQVFGMLALFQLVLICFVTPGVTAAVISNERERQTLPLLLSTPLSATSIVVAKLVTALGYIFLLIIGSMPLFAIVFLFGGVEMKELLLVFAVFAMTALTLGSLGLFASTVFKKTQNAILFSYGATFVLTIVLWGVGVFMMRQQQNINPQAAATIAQTPWFSYLSPIGALQSVFDGVNAVMTMLLGSLSGGYSGYVVQISPTVDNSGTGGWLFWQIHFVIDAGIILVSICTSIFLIRPRRPFWRRRAKKLSSVLNTTIPEPPVFMDGI